MPAPYLVKTFLGWRDEQFADRTVIWRAPTGHTYVTTPGSAWLFPQLCAPTGPALPKPRAEAENHARYVAAERTQNRRVRGAARRTRPVVTSAVAPAAVPGDDPPPF